MDLDQQALDMWIVYDHPRDWPEYFIARRWSVGKGGMRAHGDLLMHKEIATLRHELQHRGLYRLERSEEDDPVIMEVWL